MDREKRKGDLSIPDNLKELLVDRLAWVKCEIGRIWPLLNFSPVLIRTNNYVIRDAKTKVIPDAKTTVIPDLIRDLSSDWRVEDSQDLREPLERRALL